MELPKLSRWPIFSLLSQEFLQGVRLACVFGSTGNEAVVVCGDDSDSEVYTLGSNTNGCLGVGDSRSSLQPRKVETLSGKGIIHLAYGSGPHVIALTKSGELYSWGHNGYGQLGLGASITTGQGTVPRRLNGSFSKFVSVACGGHHTVAVTASGEAYSWGYNNCGQLGTGDTVNYTSPKRVESGALGNIMCVSASCGSACSFVISHQRELFCWGYNGNGQLGISNNTNQTLPCKARIPESTTIQQIVCGYSHTMCLSDEGVLFTWGSNTCGQLGMGNKMNTNAPAPMPGDIGRIVDIAAVHNNNISAASVVSGKVFMWGLCRGQNILYPFETNFTSLDEVFACFASPPCTWKPLSLDSSDASGLVSCIAGRFNDPNTSDVTFIVEGQKIHVHKAILRMRCEYFNSMFQQGRWSEAEKDMIDVQQFSYNVYYCFLKYLYTDSMDSMTMDEAVEMLRLSDSYCERQLKRLCEKFVWQNVSVENVTYLMKVADKFKAESLMDFCYKFSCQHMTQVALSDGFSELDGPLAKKLFVKAAEMGVFKT